MRISDWSSDVCSSDFLRALGMQPVASGSVQNDGQWQNEDALALRAAGSPPWPDYATINPFALPEPTAPAIAAELAGVSVSLPPLLAAHAALAARSDWVVVAGVGGWCAPLAAGKIGRASCRARVGPDV